MIFCQEKHLLKEQARAINDLGLACEFFGDTDGAMKWYENALVIREKIKDYEGTADTLNNIGNLLHVKKDLVEALDYRNRSLDLYNRLDNKYGIALAHGGKATIYLDQGKISESIEEQNKGLKIREAIGDKEGIALALRGFAKVLSSENKFEKALEKLRQSIKILETLGDTVKKITVMNDIAMIFQTQGKHTEALQIYQDCLKIANEIGYKYLQASFSNNVGSALIRKKEYKKSIFLFFQSIILNKQMGLKSNEVFEWLKNLRDKQLGKMSFKQYAYQAYNDVPDENKNLIDIRQICGEQIRFTTPPSKNAPCPCGSGKLYKRCHGKE